MQQQTLNALHREYLSGKLTGKEFEGEIYNYLVYNQNKTCLSHWKRDDYEDYISWFYPKLHKAITSYRDIGASFEAFITKFLFTSSKEYRVRITSNAVAEYSAWSAHVPDLYVYERSPSYTTPAKTDINTENTITDLLIDKKGRKNTRRILALILKCYYYVSEDFAEKIAPRIGIDSSELLEMLNKIRAVRQKRDDDIYYMKERIYSQFIRCLLYEKKLSLHQERDARYNKLKLKHEKARQRLDKMRARISSIRTDATNSQVAEIIGISKGTVDTSLYKLKAKWNEMSEKAALKANLN